MPFAGQESLWHFPTTKLENRSSSTKAYDGKKRKEKSKNKKLQKMHGHSLHTIAPLSELNVKSSQSESLWIF